MCTKSSKIYEAKTKVKKEMDTSTITVGDFNISFLIMDRTRQKIKGI